MTEDYTQSRIGRIFSKRFERERHNNSRYALTSNFIVNSGLLLLLINTNYTDNICGNMIRTVYIRFVIFRVFARRYPLGVMCTCVQETIKKYIIISIEFRIVR